LGVHKVKGQVAKRAQKMQSLSICVFCGSRNGKKQAYEDAAIELGKGLAERNWSLVYGAGNVGIMGSLAKSVLRNEAEALGVIPTHLMQREIAKTDLTNLIMTENMHERKKVMFMNSDAIVLLPGGAGSLDEFFEVLTWAQIGLHKKPIILVNTVQYWTPLEALVDHVISEEFAETTLRSLFDVVDTPEEALRLIHQRLA
tara:strand:- start:480 stop:1079 length:600 start_codon:yes stop_codon:yes gene_type:complete